MAPSLADFALHGYSLPMPSYYPSSSFELLRRFLSEDLERGLSFEAALGRTENDLSFQHGTSTQKALNYTALTKVAFELGYLNTYESVLGRSDPMSTLIRQYCTDEIVRDAAKALTSDEEREQFLEHFQEVQSGLGLP